MSLRLTRPHSGGRRESTLVPVMVTHVLFFAAIPLGQVGVFRGGEGKEGVREGGAG